MLYCRLYYCPDGIGTLCREIGAFLAYLDKDDTNTNTWAQVAGCMSNWNEIVFPRLMALGVGRRLPLVVAFLLTILLAQTLAVLTWDLLPRPELEETPASLMGSTAVRRAGAKQQNQIRQISQWHLFGQVQKTAVKTKAKVIDAPETRLNLKLRGVLASSDPTIARAIIADGKGMEDAYAIDEDLPGNAVLKEIYADRVILEYRGRLETLKLPKESKINVGIATSGSSGRTNGVQRTANTLPTTSINDVQTSRLLRQYREALINEPQSLMNLLQAAPVTDADTGKLKGYRIRPGKDKKLLGKFGLKSGDVVTAVNGVALDNPIKALEIMRDLSTASSVSLNVERKGRMESFSFQVD